MRFHVLGVGPIGSLIAFHLRRALPAHPISLIVRTKGRARDLRTGGGIAIEHGGVAVTQGGFDVEVFDPLEEVVLDFVHNKRGEMRLPPGTARTPKRQGELRPMESMGVVQRPIESVIVCTKADATLPVFRRIKQRFTAESTIVLLQNGMGVYDRLVADIFRNPLERPQFVLATTSHAARSKLHGHMIQTIHSGDGDLSFGVVPDPTGERDFEKSRFVGGIAYHDQRGLSLDDLAPPPDEGMPGDRCASLRETIAALSTLTELNPSWVPMVDLDIRLKRKLVVNAVINPLTAITQSANGALFGDWYTRSMTKKICEEAAAVFAAEAASFRPVDPEETIKRTVGPPVGLSADELENEVYRISRRTSKNFSSMLQDIWKGRRTEVEYINGHLHRLGAKFGVPTPHNDMLYAIVKMKETVVPAARV